MVTPELAVLAIALLLSTSSISIYSWLVVHGKRLNSGIWALRLTAVLPGLLSILWAIYTMATGNESPFGMALLTAGVLLVGGGVQLLSLLVHESKSPPESRPNTGQ